MGKLSELAADLEVAKGLVSSGRAPLDYLCPDEIRQVAPGRVIIALMQAASALEDVATATRHGYRTTHSDDLQMDRILRLIERIRKEEGNGL